MTSNEIFDGVIHLKRKLIPRNIYNAMFNLIGQTLNKGKCIFLSDFDFLAFTNLQFDLPSNISVYRLIIGKG